MKLSTSVLEAVLAAEYESRSCVLESPWQQREGGQAEEVVVRQVRGALARLDTTSRLVQPLDRLRTGVGHRDRPDRAS